MFNFRPKGIYSNGEETLMAKDIANFILYDLSKKARLSTNITAHSGVISDLVEGWNRHVYVVPNNALRFYRRENKKNFKM